MVGLKQTIIKKKRGPWNAALCIDAGDLYSIKILNFKNYTLHIAMIESRYLKIIRYVFGGGVFFC